MVNSSSPLFSIITITKNPGDSFHRTAHSILSQQHADFEWIVVDGSTEQRSRKIVLSYTHYISRIVNDVGNGISSAWNQGISLARGSYILLLNSGDTYVDDFLQCCARYVDGNNIVCGHPMICDIHGRPIRLYKTSLSKTHLGMYIAHEWMCIPRQIYANLGPYLEISHAMDFEYIKRILSHYGRSIFVPIPLQTCGCFYLGGLSDKYFLQSQIAAFGINLIYAIPLHQAASHLILAISKHLVKTCLIKCRLQ